MLINCFICYNCALLFLFQGLCKQNLEQDEDEAFKTTDGDLQGFWDLMMIQVEELDASYQGILLDVWPQYFLWQYLQDRYRVEFCEIYDPQFDYHQICLLSSPTIGRIR